MYNFSEIQAGILKNPSVENCGFILKDGKVVFVKNTAENPEKTFRIAPEETLKYVGNIEYIFHSHVVNPRKPAILDPRTPSKEDLLGQINSGIKWLIFANDSEVVLPPLQIPRIPNNDYLDRPFCWYINDCYTLVQDYYLFEMNIALPAGKILDTNDIRKRNYVFDIFLNEYGFKELFDLEDLRNGDLFIVDNGGLHANHLLIYDNGEVLHQDLLSKREPFEAYYGRFKKRIRYAG